MRGVECVCVCVCAVLSVCAWGIECVCMGYCVCVPGLKLYYFFTAEKKEGL